MAFPSFEAYVMTQLLDKAPPSNLPKLMLSVSEAIQVSGISRPMLYKLWRTGQGPARLSVGSRTLISALALSDWVESLTNKSPQNDLKAV